jgi:hypothetical protein
MVTDDSPWCVFTLQHGSLTTVSHCSRARILKVICDPSFIANNPKRVWRALAVAKFNMSKFVISGVGAAICVDAWGREEWS